MLFTENVQVCKLLRIGIPTPLSQRTCEQLKNRPNYGTFSEIGKKGEWGETNDKMIIITN